MFERIAQSIWHDSEVQRLPGGVIFHARCTVVRLGDGGLWVHSPIPFDDARAAELDALGPVRHIVAPCRFHHLYAVAAKQRWPTATLWATPALAKRLDADEWLRPDAGWGELEAIEIAGAPKMREFVFLHPASRTLIVTDLVFHVHYETNWLTRLVLTMAGAHGGRLAQSRLWRSLVKDRELFRESIEDLLGRDFDRVIMAHGDPIETGGRARLRQALWWGLGEPKPAAE